MNQTGDVSEFEANFATEPARDRALLPAALGLLVAAIVVAAWCCLPAAVIWAWRWFL